MNYSKLNLGSLLIVALLLITGCASSGNKIVEDLTLKSHLMRDRNIEFSGSSVYVKYASLGSFSDSKLEPLFIINGIDAGRGFSNAENVVSGETIVSVEVYKPSQAGRWGGRGAHGVVIVKTKSASGS